MYHYENYGVMGVRIISFIEGEMYEPEDDPDGNLLPKIADKLRMMHKNNICHGDVTSPNILVEDYPPRVWLIDLGLANEDETEKGQKSEIRLLDSMQ